MLKFILMVGALLWLWHSPAVRGWRGIKPPPSQRKSPDTATHRAPPMQHESMVQCAKCGIHLPQSEALKSASGQLYCCAEHRLTERA